MGGGFDVYLTVAGERLAGVYVEYSDLLVYRCDQSRCPEYGDEGKRFNDLPTGG